MKFAVALLVISIFIYLLVYSVAYRKRNKYKWKAYSRNIPFNYQLNELDSSMERPSDLTYGPNYELQCFGEYAKPLLSKIPTDKLLFGLPVLLGYFKILYYLNQQCTTSYCTFNESSTVTIISTSESRFSTTTTSVSSTGKTTTLSFKFTTSTTQLIEKTKSATSTFKTSLTLLSSSDTTTTKSTTVITTTTSSFTSYKSEMMTMTMQFAATTTITKFVSARGKRRRSIQNGW
jgi:hypothetical protein